MKTAIEALASHLNYDISELKEYRYQPSRSTKPIYSIGDDYLTCIKGKQKPAQSTERNADEWFWEEIKNDFVNKYGFKILRRLTEDEIIERNL